MLRSANGLFGFAIEATDDSIGSVYDFFFDDDGWAIRYLVVETAKWLPGRRVLLSPQSFYRLEDGRKPDWDKEVFPVSLTREQIKNSPHVATDKPVSRQQEVELFSYYEWTPYWGPYGGTYPLPAAIRPPVDPAAQPKREEGDPHLRSMREVEGYRIHAADGEIGHLEDFLIEEESWLIRHIVVDTRNWLPGKRVLVSSDWVAFVDWAERKVGVDLEKKAIRNGPPYDPAEPVSREYEEGLFDYYQRSPYWQRV